MAPTAQEIETRKMTPLQEVRQTMESKEMREQIKMALPPHISVDKFIRVVTTAISNDPKLMEADRRSLYNAAMKAASDGLIPDGKLAALVVFSTNVGTKDRPVWEKQVQYMPMVAGILQKIRNSGELATITSLLVYKNEKFRYWIDKKGENIEHEPLIFGEKGDPIGVYAMAETKDGAVYFEVMSKEQVMAIRSVAKTKFIWDGPFGEEKWKVACIRRLSKRLPMSTDLEQVIQRGDDDIELAPTATPKKTETPEPAKQTSSRLSKIVGVQTLVPTAVNTAEPNEDPNVGDGEVPI